MWTVWTAWTGATLLHLGPPLVPWTPLLEAGQPEGINSISRWQVIMKPVSVKSLMKRL